MPGTPRIRRAHNDLVNPKKVRIGSGMPIGVLSDSNGSGYPAYWSTYANFGDRLTPLLIQRIHKVKVRHVPRRGQVPPVWVIGVGSILTHRSLTGAFVWGTGVVKPQLRLTGKPRKVLVVRGPLTRDWLVKQGVDCSGVIFGDPGLLVSRWFAPATKKVNRLAVVPHRVDFDHSWVKKCRKQAGVVVVDLNWPVDRVIQSITSAEAVLSSSLHGLIAADAYGIPSLWVEFSDKVWGAGFKFRDYQLSLGGPVHEALRISNSVTVTDCISKAEPRTVELDMDEIIRRCPTKSMLGVS